MKEIELTRGKVALVDDENFEYLNQWKWMARESGNNYYAVRGVRKNRKLQNIAMHRIIMNTSNELQVDHIDHNGLNNQKVNLRNCTRQQNMMNKALTKRNKTKFKGVSTSMRNGQIKISADIKAEGRTIYLGRFKTLESAALAYNEAAVKYFGEFAYLNNVNNKVE